jgi:hypothetical protein
MKYGICSDTAKFTIFTAPTLIFILFKYDIVNPTMTNPVTTQGHHTFPLEVTDENRGMLD